jgi:SAM-dependent MidA family methyltransferase
MRVVGVYVDVDSEASLFGHWPLSTPRLLSLSSVFDRAGAGQIIEINLAIDDWFSAVAAKARAGFSITVDYGAEAAELYDPRCDPRNAARFSGTALSTIYWLSQASMT